MAKERIGVMGGSFNPVHQRHIDMAGDAKREQSLDRVLFLPTGNPPHKHEGLAPAEDRFEMTRLAVSGIPGFSASRMELDREGVIYTVDTLALLHKRYPDAEIFYIIGEDTMLDLVNWRKPDKVFTLCEFIVCPRSSVSPAQQPIYKELIARGARLHFLALPPKDVSSTVLRQRLRAREQPPEIAPQVMEYIRVTGLYGVPKSPAGADGCYARLKSLLSEKRLTHSLLVSSTARRLAALHGVNQEQAAQAGLFHDCAKCIPLAQMQRIAREHRLLLDRETLQSENLLHGYAGAAMAEELFGIADPNVLSAIRCHTTGKVGMLPLDMILYLADKIEPSRRDYPALAEVRRAADVNLSRAMSLSLRSTLAYVKAQGRTPHPATQRVADWLDRLIVNHPNKA